MSVPSKNNFDTDRQITYLTKAMPLRAALIQSVSRTKISAVTQVDRYVLTIFFRTVIVCFLSIAGIFVVFHAFNTMDDLLQQGREKGSLPRVLIEFYGPYLLMLFDWTAAIITLVALLFTVGWLRRTGELTATLSIGVSHGRVFRPLVLASLTVIGLQLLTRELVLPHYQEHLSTQGKDVSGEEEQAVLAQYDRANRILVDGASLIASQKVIHHPSFRIDGDYPEFGEMILAKTAHWQDANEDHPAGYLLEELELPKKITHIPSAYYEGRPILLTPHDFRWLESNQCFFATSIDPGLLQTSQSAAQFASIPEIAGYLRNPAVYNSLSMHVLLHERVLRLPLDFSLVLLGLPLLVNRRGRNLFVLIGLAMFTVILFFAVRTFAGWMGSGGYFISPIVAAWIPLLVFGPIAYMRLRYVQTV